MNMTRCLGSLVVGLLVALAPAGAAFAQNALGSGDVLDANPAVGLGGRNVPARLEDFRARNLLITGNVAAGRGFRGTVGYIAANDFRGELGSDELFQFRADSALSRPSFIAAGRTLDKLRFGQYLGAIEFRRAGHAATQQTLREIHQRPGTILDERIMLDRIALSSSTTMAYHASAEPEIVGVMRDEQGQVLAASASSLRGLHLSPMQEQGQLLGLSSFDLARAREDRAAGRQVPPVGAPFEASFQDLRPDGLVQTPLVGEGLIEPQTVQTRVEPGYQAILQRVADRYAAQSTDQDVKPSLLAHLDEQFAHLRRQLEEADQSLPTTESADEAAEADGQTRPGFTTPPKLEDFGVILRHGERLDRLASDDPSRFNELLASAEQHLRSGEYFWAERHFTRALRFTPDHPLATAGLAHAQIGAGLYLPASLALRRLLTRHPEMIDVQYSHDLMPSRVRLNIAIRTLRERIERQHDRALYAFLLAYIGHQLGDRSLIEEGLEALEQTRADDPLLPVLKPVWLGEPTDQP